MPTGSCTDGERQGCQIDIDDHNCFVGESECVGGEWGPCEEGALPLAIGPQAACTTNPCNPQCETFDEVPMPGISLTLPPGPPPGGSVNGLPAAWQDAGLQDDNHIGTPCDGPEDCNYDHFCDIPSGNCMPWPGLDFDMTGPALADLTMPIVCNGSAYVCNRGDVQAPIGVEVNVFTADVNDIGKCTGITGAPLGECTVPSTIDPGQCVPAPGCDPFLSGLVTLHVNGADQAPPAPIAEISCENNWSVYNNGGVCSCSAQSVAQGLTPVSMYLFLDSSGSMSSGGLWLPAKSALTTFVQDPAADNLQVALRTYDDPPPGNGCDTTDCDVGACSTPFYPADFLSNATHEANLVSFLSTAVSNGGTPHSAAVDGATTWGVARAIANPGETVAIVYITDGVFSGCIEDEPTVAGYAAAAFLAQGVLTYTVALPGSDTSLLAAIATAGSTTMIDLTASADIDADLTAALVGIQQSLLTCDLAIPNAGQVDPLLISYEYLPAGIPPAVTLNNVGDVSGCTTGTDEFYLDDPVNPTIATLCPDTCSPIQADSSAILNFIGGCVGQTYGQEVFNYEYSPDCSGYPNTQPQWDFFAYNTTIPGNSRVEFEVRVAETQAGLAAAMWIPIATANTGNEIVSLAMPIDLFTLLGPALAYSPWLELQVTLTPTSDGLQTPIVNDWDFQLTCANTI